MSKKKEGSGNQGLRKIKDEVVIDKVNEIFRTQPDNYFVSFGVRL